VKQPQVEAKVSLPPQKEQTETSPVGKTAESKKKPRKERVKKTTDAEVLEAPKEIPAPVVNNSEDST
jgi:hypothetical protein